MQFHNLKKNTANKKSARIGRGGKRGKTSGRGTKGQNARAGRKKRPEMRDVIKRLPKLRGRGVNSLKTRHPKAKVIELKKLATIYGNGEKVTRSSLVEKKLVSLVNGVFPAVKILSTLHKEDIGVALTVEGIATSASAREAIMSAGGTVT
jgi:large subunit ribosomal protein L15